jgi:hypothetical protein
MAAAAAGPGENRAGAATGRPIEEDPMSDTTLGGSCASCGNHYDKAFTVTTYDGEEAIFDSVECAIAWIAPTCAECNIRILGHGVESDAGIFCCAHCAEMAGDERLVDRAETSRT